MRNNYLSNNRISDNHGFIATTAVLMIAYGCLALALVSTLAVRSYSESVDLREARIEARRLNDLCMHRALEILAREYFVRGKVELPEYNCEIEYIEKVPSQITIQTTVRYLTVIMSGSIDTFEQGNRISVIKYQYD